MTLFWFKDLGNNTMNTFYILHLKSATRCIAGIVNVDVKLY